MKLSLTALFCTAVSLVYSQTVPKERLDSLTSAYAASGYHGVIRIAKDGKLLYEKAYGLANLEKNIPHTPATVFKTESVGKMFTAVSILQLVEKGKLRFDQTVKELLPELSLPDADKITVHHLLNHTSGLQSPWDHPNWKFKTIYTREEMQRIITEVPRAFDSVGKEMYYSNSGYVLLSWMIEKVSGQPFDAYFSQYIFKPAGMKETRHLGDTLMPEKNGAQPYRIFSSTKYIRMNQTLGAKAGGAGGWISTAKDLQLFMHALHSGQLISPAMLNVMRTANGTKPKEKVRRFYAYGLEIYPNSMVPGAEIYGHNGGGAGFSIDAFADATSGYIVTSCVNQYANTRPIMENYMRLMLQQPLNKVSTPGSRRLYDMVEAKGINAVLADTSIFSQLNIKLTPGFIAQMGDAFLGAKDYAAWDQWMEWGQKFAPEEAFLKMVYADGFLERGMKAEAKKMYQAGRELALKQKDQQGLQYAERQLKGL